MTVVPQPTSIVQLHNAAPSTIGVVGRISEEHGRETSRPSRCVHGRRELGRVARAFRKRRSGEQVDARAEAAMAEGPPDGTSPKGIQAVA